MKDQKLFLVGTHRYSFRAGEPAEIIGVAMVVPEDGDEPRPCFNVRFKDGSEDYTSIFAMPGNNEVVNPHYELISEEDALAGRIPEVVH